MLRHPYRISLNKLTGDILGSRVDGSSLRFNAGDIRGYSRARVWMDEEHHKSVILYFKDGRKKEVCEFVVRPIEALTSFLRERGVGRLGEERSWFPFRKFKYHYVK